MNRRDLLSRLKCKVLGHRWHLFMSMYDLFGRPGAVSVCLRCRTFGTRPLSSITAEERARIGEPDVEVWIDSHPLISRPADA